MPNKVFTKEASESLVRESLDDLDQVVAFSYFCTATGSYTNIYIDQEGKSFCAVAVSRAALEAVLLKMDALEAKRKCL